MVCKTCQKTLETWKRGERLPTNELIVAAANIRKIKKDRFQECYFFIPYFDCIECGQTHSIPAEKSVIEQISEMILNDPNIRNNGPYYRLNETHTHDMHMNKKFYVMYMNNYNTKSNCHNFGEFKYGEINPVPAAKNIDE
jgi:hypothetical protein